MWPGGGTPAEGLVAGSWRPRPSCASQGTLAPGTQASFLVQEGRTTLWALLLPGSPLLEGGSGRVLYGRRGARGSGGAAPAGTQG